MQMQIQCRATEVLAMFHHNPKSIRHALDLAPTHIRYRQKFKIGTSKLSGCIRRGNTYFGSPGIYSLLAHRNQRCIVKISYTQNTKTRSWAAHGAYLQREHAQELGEKGAGFNHESNSIDIRTTLRQWQKDDDSHMFKLIVSLENGHKLDLKQHAKDLMVIVQNDFKTRLEWVAIDHHNTDHPHLHILIRGIDDRGKTLIIERDYLSHGFRHHSEDLVTRVLGLRLNRDIVHIRTLQIEREYVTELDRSILRKAENSIVNYHTSVSDNLFSQQQRLLEIKRLIFLEKHGLAEKINTKAWKLDNNLELILQQRQLSNDIIKSRANHNINTLTYEMPVPTQVHERKPLTGKVVGMGLENELKDQRYLLLEGIDGKVHYLEATNSIVKARNNFELSNNNVITLEKIKFVNEQGRTIEYLTIQNHHSLDELQRAPHSRLDRDVIEFVKTHGTRLSHNFPEQSFAHEYANSMVRRFNELEREKIFTHENNHYSLAPDWEKKLENISRQRQLNLTNEISLYEHSQKKKHELTLESGGRSRSIER
jgi:type IV secretory pathway VirD2 relaxase